MKMPRIQFCVRLAPGERDLLDSAATAHGLSASALLRAGGLRLARALTANAGVDALVPQGDENSAEGNTEK